MLDKKRIGSVDFQDFATAISTITKGTISEQISCEYFPTICNSLVCFNLYDGDSDSKISRDEFESARMVMISLLLRNKTLLRELFNQNDSDKDNKLSLDEFTKAVLGPLVPSNVSTTTTTSGTASTPASRSSSLSNVQ